MADVMNCRICGTPIDRPALDLPAPALATTNEQLPVCTRVYICTSCGHAQSPTLPNSEQFYDIRYKYSLASEEYDQLYEVRDGAPLYRTDAQAALVLDLASLRVGASVLDYGAAKAATLRKMCAQRPDLSPHVFDISEDYRSSWAAWLPNEAIATYTIPSNWSGRFELVTAHYVLQHVQDPVATLRSLSTLLTSRGGIFFSAPDWSANTGALLVAENTNHFTEVSIRRLAREAALTIDKLDSTSLPCTFAVLCHASHQEGTGVAPTDVDAAVAHARSITSAWSDACRRLDTHISANRGRRSAIFGAGFYAAFLLTRIADRARVLCCVDSNPHLWGKTIFGIPIASPEALPSSTEVVYVGLNPKRARAIAATVSALQRPGLDLIFIEN
jgi:2-polyprenyl-3-methyl-5-hydroxy-6-metoxy-1,4-benzoquinol methylase